MHYKFATERPDYSHLASGHVLYSLPGHPAFPVRLVSEIFQRCQDWRKRAGETFPCTLFDPCCGGGYSLSVLGYLHREVLRGVIGSDVGADAVACAQRNLTLLTSVGLDRRVVELEDMLARYGKTSHHEALRSAEVLRRGLAAHAALPSLEARTFQADATDGAALRREIPAGSVDVVVTDIPYGQHSHWVAGASDVPLEAMLEALRGVLTPTGLVAITADKQARPAHSRYRRLEQFQVGKRRVVILQVL